MLKNTLIYIYNLGKTKIVMRRGLLTSTLSVLCLLKPT